MHLSWRHYLIDRRAAQIDDPVKRLRYLRAAVGDPPSATMRVLTRALSADFWRRRGTWMMFGAAVLVFVVAGWRPGHNTVKAAARLPQRQSLKQRSNAPVTAVLQPGTVWLVDHRGGVENYSNGLRIDNKYAVPNEPRQQYAVYGYGKSGKDVVGVKTAPAGIVYHTTESHLAPFESGQNRRLVRIGSAVLEYVQSNRSYHFVIDRFGRVFRIVNETDMANHAGMSIWGDERGAYINLNASFLGIAFESATDTDTPAATPAQMHSARVLTEMLRSKYGIPAGNCVTHAQVSVNPGYMLIGYHTDWAGVFPFEELGLPDNYATPPVSMSAFGFGYDDMYLKVTGNRVRQGLLAAEDQMRREAAASGLPLAKYKAGLQQRYREITAALKPKSTGKEIGDEIE